MTVALWKQVRYEKMERDFLADLANLDNRTLEMLWRQQASQERFFSKALADLQRLRKFRSSAPIESEPIEVTPEEVAAPPAPPEPAPPESVMHPAPPPTSLRPIVPVAEPVCFGPSAP